MKIKLSGDWKTREVKLSGKKLNPKPSQKLRNHSPNEFCWGYGGSAPGQLALAICLKLWGQSVALSVYQDFKWAFTSLLPEKDFNQQLDLTEFIKEHGIG